MNLVFLFIVPVKGANENICYAFYESFCSQEYTNWRIAFVVDRHEPRTNILDTLALIDKRVSMVRVNNDNTGIYNAMNEGLRLTIPYDYIAFWGLDDRFTDRKSLLGLHRRAIHAGRCLSDLILCEGTYTSATGNALHRISLPLHRFLSMSLLLGYSPPHQGVFISNKFMKPLGSYRTDLKIASDLDLIIRASILRPKLQYISDSVVTISSDGYSSRNSLASISEVASVYYKYYCICSILPLFARYISRALQYKRFIYRFARY